LKGAMHQSETLIRDIYYGFDTGSLFIRLDVNLDLANSESKDFSYVLTTLHPHQYRIDASYKSDKGKHCLDIYELVDDHWSFVKTIESVGIKRIVEAAVPFADIKAVPNDEIQFVVAVEKNRHELERWPRGGSINFAVPTPDYEEKQWSV
jgi:hypothetical protein